MLLQSSINKKLESEIENVRYRKGRVLQNGRRRRVVSLVRRLDGRGDGKREHSEGAGEADGSFLFHISHFSLRGFAFWEAKLELSKSEASADFLKVPVKVRC